MRTIAAAAVALSAPLLGACGQSQASDAGAGAGTGSGPAGSPTAVPTAQTVTDHETEFKIDPQTLSLKAGDYRFVYINDGKFAHDLHVTGQGSAQEVKGATAAFKPGEMGSFAFTLKPGTYSFFCAVLATRTAG